MGRLCQAPLRRARGGARLSVALYPSGGNLELAPACPRRARRHLPLEGLPRLGQGALQGHDAERRGVHPALPATRPAQWLSPYPALRAARQWRPAQASRASSRSVARCSCRDRTAAERGSIRRERRTHLRLPALWRGDERGRNLRAARIDPRTTHRTADRMNSGTGTANPMSTLRQPPPRADAFALGRRHPLDGAHVMAASDATLPTPTIDAQSAAVHASASRLLI